jgi:hypothetical protein
MKRAVALALVTIGVALVACRKGPPFSTMNVTSGTYDVEPGACLCRTSQDEFISCCRSAMEMTCRCDRSAGCQMVPTGRTCGKTPPVEKR